MAPNTKTVVKKETSAAKHASGRPAKEKAKKDAKPEVGASPSTPPTVGEPPTMEVNADAGRPVASPARQISAVTREAAVSAGKAKVRCTRAGGVAFRSNMAYDEVVKGKAIAFNDVVEIDVQFGHWIRSTEGWLPLRSQSGEQLFELQVEQSNEEASSAATSASVPPCAPAIAAASVVALPTTSATLPSVSPAADPASMLVPMQVEPSSAELVVRYSVSGDLAAPLYEGLVRLRRAGDLCDIDVCAEDGSRFRAHTIVLAAHGGAMERRVREAKAPVEGAHPQLQLGSVRAGAVEWFLRWAYGEVSVTSYLPTSDGENEDLLRIAAACELPRLAELCGTVLARGVDVKNAVARVKLCEDFGLPALRSALLEALVESKTALAEVACDPATMAHPVLMRELVMALAARAGGFSG